MGGGEVDVFYLYFVGRQAKILIYGDDFGVERDVAPGGKEGGFVGLEEGCVCVCVEGGREEGREGGLERKEVDCVG